MGATKTIMKICLYSPYFPKHFGGGEKYLLDVALILAQKHEIFLALAQSEAKTDKEFFAETKQIKLKHENFLGKKLDKLNFINSPFTKNLSKNDSQHRNNNFLQKLLWTKQFDVFYYQTDGSLFFSLAQKNILHIQTPLKLNKNNFFEKLKLANWQIKNTNSLFTKRIIEKFWKTKINLVHTPMVDIPNFSEQKLTELINKIQKIILNVGRFFTHLHAKRQDILVEIFKNLIKKYPQETKNWHLVLIGSVENQIYAAHIAKLAKDLPVTIIHQTSRKELLNWYRKTSIYWHATGFGIDQEKNPEKVEHFGITTIEAMAYGCVPVVIKKGGQIEILGDKLSQLLWETKQDCIQKTYKLISGKNKKNQLAKLAYQQSKNFSKTIFETKLWQMIDK